MSCIEGKLGYDLALDLVYIDKGTIFGEYLALRTGDRIRIKRNKAWADAVLSRDIGGWYLDLDGVVIRKFEGRCARLLRTLR